MTTNASTRHDVLLICSAAVLIGAADGAFGLIRLAFAAPDMIDSTPLFTAR